MLSLKTPLSFLSEALLRVPPSQLKGQRNIICHCIKNTVKHYITIIKQNCNIPSFDFDHIHSLQHNISI